MEQLGQRLYRSIDNLIQTGSHLVQTGINLLPRLEAFVSSVRQHDSSSGSEYNVNRGRRVFMGLGIVGVFAYSTDAVADTVAQISEISDLFLGNSQRKKKPTLQVTLKEVIPTEAEHMEDGSQLATAKWKATGNPERVELYVGGKMVFFGEGPQIGNSSTQFPIQFVGPQDVVAKVYKGTKSASSNHVIVTGLDTPPKIFDVKVEDDNSVSLGANDLNKDTVTVTATTSPDGKNLTSLGVRLISGDLYKTDPVPSSDVDQTVALTASEKEHGAKTESRVIIKAKTLDDFLLNFKITSMFPFPIEPLNGALGELYPGDSKIEGSRVLADPIASVRVSHDGLGSLNVSAGPKLLKISHTELYLPYIVKLDIRGTGKANLGDIGLELYDQYLLDLFSEVAQTNPREPGNFIGVEDGTVKWDPLPRVIYINTNPALGSLKPITQENIQNARTALTELIRFVNYDAGIYWNPEIKEGTTPEPYETEGQLRQEWDDFFTGGTHAEWIEHATNRIIAGLVSYNTKLTMIGKDRQIHLKEPLQALGLRKDTKLDHSDTIISPTELGVVDGYQPLDARMFRRLQLRYEALTKPDNNLLTVLLQAA